MQEFQLAHAFYEAKQNPSESIKGLTPNFQKCNYIPQLGQYCVSWLIAATDQCYNSRESAAEVKTNNDDSGRQFLNENRSAAWPTLLILNQSTGKLTLEKSTTA